MKKLSIFLALVATTGTLQAALPLPDLIAEAYFAGAQKISAAANVNAFTNEFCSAPALALRKQTADKLSVWLAGWLQLKTGASVPDGAARLRPLLDDLQHSEFMFEARASAGVPEVALAIRLEAARKPAWSAGLKPFLPASSFTTSGDWLIFDSSTGRLGAALAQKAALSHGGWFTLDVNWPRLAQWFPEAGRLALPETQFTVTAPDANFHIAGKFIYPQPLGLNLEAWKFPASQIHEPFISFTAVRGFASWLASQPWAQSYELMPMPNQAFIWAGRSVPFATYAAAPVSDPAAALAQIYAQWQPRLDSQNATMFHFTVQQTNGQVLFIGLPMVAPYFQAVNDPAGRFLFAGGFPNLPSRKPIPTELFTRLAIPNLVLYHWEITSERVGAILQPMQLGLMVTGHLQLDGNSAAYKWLSNLAPQLGNTDTEITETAPDQLTFNRTAPGIFTAAELYVLANWLEAKNFPGYDIKAPSLNKLRRVHPKLPAATAPPPPK